MNSLNTLNACAGSWRGASTLQGRAKLANAILILDGASGKIIDSNPFLCDLLAGIDSRQIADGVIVLGSNRLPMGALDAVFGTIPFRRRQSRRPTLS
ncbi:MAG TPA: hypothetical protein VG099_10385 [Gemmataceae bacterium]|jgi:hypothetical protein|nr:hypothetical protein [Gemmataceae bacterium]